MPAARKSHLLLVFQGSGEKNETGQHVYLEQLTALPQIKHRVADLKRLVRFQENRLGDFGAIHQGAVARTEVFQQKSVGLACELTVPPRRFQILNDDVTIRRSPDHHRIALLQAGFDQLELRPCADFQRARNFRLGILIPHGASVTGLLPHASERFSAPAIHRE